MDIIPVRYIDAHQIIAKNSVKESVVFKKIMLIKILVIAVRIPNNNDIAP